jgi:hypothetical protein
MHAALGQNIDLSLKEFFEVLTERNEIEQGPTGLHLDQQVDVAIGTILPAGDRSKDADVACTVACRDPKNVRAPVPRVHLLLFLCSILSDVADPCAFVPRVSHRIGH